MWLVEAGDLTEGNNIFLVFAFFFCEAGLGVGFLPNPRSNMINMIDNVLYNQEKGNRTIDGLQSRRTDQVGTTAAQL